MKVQILGLMMMGFAGSALADEVPVYCDLFSKKVDGGEILGVKVSNYELGYEQISWFGANSGFQKIARDACLTVLDSINCRRLESNSASATMLVDKELGAHLDEITLNEIHGKHISVSGLNDRAFENAISCNEERAELAHEMVRNVQKKFLQNPNQAFLETRSLEDDKLGNRARRIFRGEVKHLETEPAIKE